MSQGYTASQIVMDVCMLNIFLHWGTVHWQYVSRGLVSYNLMVYMYVHPYVKYFLCWGTIQSVTYDSRGLVIACCIYVHTITDIVYIFAILLQQTLQ